ncbi:MAG: 30S ribosomal protein S12 methylthiotransferase RimO [Caldilineales bacterium]|nr:30S ribosomal protein S12 methylthiotransferase RimO [Caldilineales bacterium]
MSRKTRQSSYYLLTLGCPKNQVDSDGMASLLDEQGYRLTDNPRWADVLIVNTCGFLEASKEESIAALQELSSRKSKNQVLVAAGCLAERNSQEIVQRVRGVDGLLGTNRWMDIAPLVENLRSARRGRGFERIALLGEPESQNAEPTPRNPVQGASAYLKISDGCNAPCTFCSIPSFKGKLRSHDFEAVIAEAQALTAAGAKELIVVAQDTTDYGRDRGEANSLARLLAAIAHRTNDLRWLRLMYAYPGHVTNELIETMAATPQILPYLDIPLQHGHPATLRRMHRPSNVDMVRRSLESLREAMPDIALRTTFIVGFPGETEEEFQGLLDFVQDIRFDKVGAFTFSPEPGTPAATLPDQVEDEVKQERWERLMAAQQPISLQRNQAQIGKSLTVLVEGHGDGLSLARSYRDAPEIDGFVLLAGIHPMGEMMDVNITGAMEYDLVGEPVRAEASIGAVTQIALV